MSESFKQIKGIAEPCLRKYKNPHQPEMRWPLDLIELLHPARTRVCVGYVASQQLECSLGSWLAVQLCGVELLSKCYGERKTSMPLPCNHCIAIVKVLLWSLVPLGLTWFFPFLEKKWTDSIRSNIPNAKQSATVDWVPLFDIKNSIFVCVQGNLWKSKVLSA